MTAEYKVHGDIAIITLNNPPVNGLGHSTRLGIAEALEKANANAAACRPAPCGRCPRFSGFRWTGCSQEKFDEMQKELETLKTVRRTEIAKNLEYARSLGDLSENAEYEAAKDRQGFIEGRIKEVEGKLGNAQIIDPASLDADGRVVFGATVELEDMAGAKTVTYQIVGDDEADLKAGKVSINSPVARALIGKYAGDVAVVQTPGGVREYEVLDVKYL